MKLKGKRPGPHIELIVLPRGGDDDIVLKAKAVENMDEFNKLCPLPEAPKKKLAGGEVVPDLNDKGYQQAVTNHGQKRLAYMVIKGLSEGTPDLEWENVNLSDHSTWDKYSQELREAGFSDIEISRVVSGVMRANSLSEAAIEEARQRFLASEQVPEDDS